uniref:Uncharacterized protein n=1 Tax=Globodera rostochiensis TaxID=31243 RepID=A0A914H1X0_GLORO
MVGVQLEVAVLLMMNVLPEVVMPTKVLLGQELLLWVVLVLLIELHVILIMENVLFDLVGMMARIVVVVLLVVIAFQHRLVLIGMVVLLLVGCCEGIRSVNVLLGQVELVLLTKNVKFAQFG